MEPPSKKVRFSHDDDSELGWWVEHLRNIPSLQLPTDFPRPFPHQVVEAEESLRLNNSICMGLLKLGLENDITPFTSILATFAVILRKYTREEEIVLGSSSSSFNPLILRVPVTDTDSFTALVAKVKSVEENAAAHEILYDRLYNKLRPPTEESTGPLFQVRILNVSDVQAHTLEAASCDWTIFVEQLSDAKSLLPLKLRVVYNTILFARERIQEMLRQVEGVLSMVTKNQQTLVGEISMMTSSKKMLPDPEEPLDASFFGSIQSYLSTHAGMDPNRTAIVTNTKKYTYKYVDETSNKIANYLIRDGIKKGDIVAIFAHRSTAIVLAIMGVLKAGATFTVIDPAYPPERQVIYLEVSEPKGFITMQRAGKLMPEVQKYIDEKLKILSRLDALDPDNLGAVGDLPPTNPNIEIGPDDIGTLSFTSGSTGKPKGVRGRHISYTHFYPWMKQEFSLSESDHFSLLSGIAHDPIQRDIFTPFFLGASIHIPEAEDISSPGRLAEWMAEQKVSVTHLTPAMGQLLTANAVAEMPALRVALFVGDILTKRDVIRLQNLAPNVTVVNMYGTTETQRAVSYLAIPNDNMMSQRKDIIPAGRGMKDVQLLILTPDMRQCGIGEMGEIYSRSPHMAAGYLGLDEATKVKFLQNPFRPDDLRDRLYRTGDLGRYLPNGIVECVGRADDQVKIRGFRIELGEIDTYLSQHPDVRENVTVVRRDINEEHTLVSYFVPLREEYDQNSIREHLKTKLPSYAIPKIFVPLAAMPLTPNGKIDRTKLPFPDTFAVSQQKRATPARNPVEAKLADIWCSLLGLPSVDVFDNFFDLGGHSILATRLIFQLRQEFKVDLPLNMLFDNPTVATLAQAVTRQIGDSGLVLQGNNQIAPAAEKPLDLAAEVELAPEITGVGKKLNFVVPTSSILLTGATGFLGAFLLQGFLKKYPQASIHCLVRADTVEKGRERLKQNLENHHIWEESFSSRIVPVLGDLGKPRLGLSEVEFKKLSQVQAIVHNGATVHWVYPYQKLKATNVESTKELLKIATMDKLIPIHFVSSTSVFDSEHYINNGETKVTENDTLEGGKGLTVGYGQSKWVSEKILLEARSRSVPVTIIRPGYVVGHSRTGVTNADDFLWRLVKGCLQLGSVPIMRNKVNMCPVDYVADLIIHITSKEDCLGKAFHTINPATFRFDNYFQLLMDYGYALTPIDYMKWRQDLMDLTLSTSDNALYPLLHFVLDDLPTKSKSPDLDASNSEAAIADSTIRCAPMSEVMGIYISYLVQSGFLTPPTVPNKKILPKLDIEAKILTRSDRGSA